MDAVSITAADFNGKTFDGSPFGCMPDWLSTALEDGTVFISRDAPPTDYAMWSVRGKEGVVGPDDFVVQTVDGDIHPVRGEDLMDFIEGWNTTSLAKLNRG